VVRWRAPLRIAFVFTSDQGQVGVEYTLCDGADLAIAYRQPMGRVEVEYIRGVSSSGVIRTLQDRGLIDVVGRGEGLGRPLLYGTTPRFLEHFGFSNLEDLPRPEELPVVLRENPPLGEDGEGGSLRGEQLELADSAASDPELTKKV